MLKQYTLVARAMPDEHKDLGTAVCSAGLCPDDGLIRVYPLFSDVRMRQWITYEVDVERDPSDSRKETWRPDLSFAPHPVTEKTNTSERYRLLGILTNNFLATSIEQLNEEKRSLAVIIPDRITKLRFAMRSTDDLSKAYCKKKIPEQPRITYQLDGKIHDQQLMEWGCYMAIMKNRPKCGCLWDNLRFQQCGYRHIFLIGNYRNYRNAWGIITVLPIKLDLWRKHSGPVLPFRKLEKQSGFSTCTSGA